MQSAIDLTTVAGVKEWAEVDPTNTSSDAMIQAIITGFSRWVQQYTGVSCLTSVQQFTETRNGNGNGQMFVKNVPCLASPAPVLTINGVAIPYSSSYNAPGFFVADDGKSILFRSGVAFGNTAFTGFRALTQNNIFTRGVGNVLLVYSAGFPQGVVVDESNVIPASGSPVISVQTPFWVADTGVKFFIGGTALVAVGVAPAAGQYYVAGAGVYQFAVADAGKQVLISYKTSGVPADLEMMARKVCALYFKRRQTIDLATKSISAGGTTGTTTYRSWGMSPEDAAVLDNYSRNSVI